jgi:hypothetical protein
LKTIGNLAMLGGVIAAAAHFIRFGRKQLRDVPEP